MMIQLILHLWGDYLSQSDWMANNKTTQDFACFCHAVTYTLPFLFVTRSPLALLVIGGSHFFIDRFRLAKYVVYAKNFLAPPSVYLQPLVAEEGDQSDWEEYLKTDTNPLAKKYRWENCQATGYPSETPPFLAVWLLIIADNTIHLTVNYLALRFL